MLRQFFDQYIFNDVVHGRDRPERVPGFEGEPVSFSLTWDIAPEDYALFPLREAFGREGVRQLAMSFTHADGPAEYWDYRADDEPIVAYEGERAGQPIRRDVLRARRLLPQPHYLELSDQYILRSEFEARLHGRYRDAEGAPLPYRPVTESVVLRLAGFLGETRSVRGIGEPWAAVVSRDVPSAAEFTEGLVYVSERVTALLRQWWDEPPGLTFRVELAGSVPFQERLNSYALKATIESAEGAPLVGTGILWFVSFLIHFLHVEEHRRPTLLLFDEPGTPLHPRMQRVVAKLIDTASRERQVIYSTHSPFMIDWSYPQRLRLFRRDWATNRTRIENKPYRGTTGLTGVWDPLLATIGVSLGDIGVIGEQNVFVEGVTDQILLSNVSEVLRRRGRPALDLTRMSIIPYGNEGVLRTLLATAHGGGARAVVLCDNDDQGRRILRWCAREASPHVHIQGFTDRIAGDSATEDVLGGAFYMEAVNRFYGVFEWYTHLDPAAVVRDQGEPSLGTYLERLFQERFGRSFSKVGVMTELASDIESLPAAVVDRLERLITAILAQLGG